MYLIFILLALFLPVVPVSAREAFTIEELDITMQIQEDGTYEIQEVYTLDFSEYRHGFYRTIPTRYEMKWTDKNGNAEHKSYYFPIDDVSCGDADTCSVDVDGDGVMIQIGDSNRTVIGIQQYTIRYRVHTKDLGVDGVQMLYWNLIGNGFDTTIRKMHYEIRMPKAFAAQGISAYTGAYGAAFQNLTYTVDGTRISGDLIEPLGANESATIMVPLDHDYFIFPEPTNYLLYALIATAAITALSLLLFFRFGKDDELITTVEFTAPDGFDSAAVGYVADATVDQKDILSLIIDWAERGYLKIHDDGNHRLSLEKCKDLGAEAKPYEHIFFNSLFRDKELVKESDLRKDHVAKGLSQAQVKLADYFHVKSRRIFTSSSIFLQILMCFIVALPSGICAAAALYMRYEMNVMTYPAFIVLVFGVVVCVPWIFLMRKRYVLKRSHSMLWGGLCFLGNAILFAVVSIMILVMGPAHAWVYALIYLALEILQLLILMFMDKRTKQGNRWLGQILGLREFIVSCEKERLELLVAQDPQAFFHILPYAYVLGVSDVWANKFEGLITAMPSWYVGPGYGNSFSSWIWWSSFHHSFARMSEAVSYVEPKGTSGGFGGGRIGGFGGGGGGFSGGGFGGGGGGSW